MEADFWKEIFKRPEDIPTDWRLGQYVFNIVEGKYGSVARKVQFQDGIDCFYDDTRVEDFLKAVYSRLTKSE